MNTETVAWDIGEALIHLQSLVADFRTGKIRTRDEPVVAVQLGHVLDHICLAWNCKDMSPDQRSQIPQDEYERLCNTVPNFCGGRMLGELALA